MLQSASRAVKLFFVCFAALASFFSRAQGSETNADGKAIENPQSLEEKALKAYSDKKFDSAREYLYLYKIFKSNPKIPEGLKQYLIENTEFSEEFSQTLSPHDNIEKVFEILSSIWSDDPNSFEKFPRIAAAIAVVFDTPPPKAWPHNQVPEKVLPRKLGNPVEVFKSKTSKSSRPLIPPDKLSIEEAKYLVSSLASEKDSAWVKKSVSVNLPNIAKLYPSIVYDKERLNSKKFTWERSDYSLETIKENGGICVDQAYFTAEAAKCKGVPAFIFTGAGGDGFHAWTAYMLKSGNWNFDVGRYEGARFVTGHTLDPQTWKPASDHALNSMRERFRDGKKYKTNLLHTEFAKKFLADKDYKKAAAAARAAIASDSRNAESWDILIEAAKGSGADDKEIRSIYENAAKAFSRYPDLEALYRKKLINSLGESDRDLAQKISGAVIIKTRRARPDIAMDFAKSDLEKEIEAGNLDRLNSSYKRLLGMFKGDAATAVNGITVPILNKLLKDKKFEATREIMKLTKQVLKSDKDASLSAAIESLSKQLNDIESKAKK